MTGTEKQGSQACSSGPDVASPLSFPPPHAPSGPGATCTGCRQVMAFLSSLQDWGCQQPDPLPLALIPPPPSPRDPAAGPRARSQKWELSAQSLRVSQPPITAALWFACSVCQYMWTHALCLWIYVHPCVMLPTSLSTGEGQASEKVVFMVWHLHVLWSLFVSDGHGKFLLDSSNKSLPWLIFNGKGFVITIRA